MFHRLSPFKDAPALFRRHVVELRQAVTHALLRLRRKIAEARLILERALLVCQRKVAMTIHPLSQMLLIWLLGRRFGPAAEWRSS